MKKLLIVITMLLTRIINTSEVISHNEKLVQAAEAGNINEVQAALKAGADVDSQTGGYTALMWAAINGNRKMVELLIKAKADLNKQNLDGRTALIFTAYYHPEIVKLLLEADANTTIKTLKNALGQSFLDLIQNDEDYAASRKVYKQILLSKLAQFLPKDPAGIVADYCV